MGAPSGTVGFLFTDIEGSTQLWDEVPDAMGPALERHDALLRAAVESRGGHVFSISGDGFGVAFERVGDAFGAAIEFQEGLASDGWPEGAVIRARMGVHVGEGVERDGNYFGTAVNRAARLMSVAHGGQLVCSQAVASMAGAEVELVDLGEHRLRDLAAAETVFQVGAGDHPPLRSVDAVPTNLPTQRTELIGRSDDVADLADLVLRERLVTLTGTGGVGKTRLSLAVAAAVADRFTDGCWFVELASITDGDEVSTAMTGAMRSPATTSAELAGYLSDRRVLVVLDNCEHLLDATADVVDEIQAAGGEVHVVATSREPLGLPGEVVRRIRSLVLPGATAAAEDAGSTAAVRLFVDRAVAADHRFALDAANVRSVAEICRQLDGIPLAIELAAARVRAMVPDEIVRRLDERFRLLGGGSRRAQERHRTLQAAVSWSHDMLSDEERVLFRRLSVFPGSFDLEAAEAVAASDGQGPDVVDGVLRLVDRSLVAFDPDAARYRMLQTLREYAADRLAETDETDSCRDRHARHYLDLAGALGPSLEDERYPEARAVVALELDNIKATADWCAEHEAWSELADLCLSLRLPMFQDAPVDYVAWINLLLNRESAIEGQVVVDLAGEMAWILANRGDFEECERLARLSDEIADRRGVLASSAARTSRAQLANYTGRYADARELAASGRVLAEERDDALRVVMAAAIRTASFGVDRRDERDEAAAELLALASAVGHPISMITAAVVVGFSLMLENGEPDYTGALEVLDRAALAGGAVNEVWRDILLGVALIGLGRPGAARRLACAIVAADRLALLVPLDVSLRALAVASARAGLVRQAAAMAAYAEAELSDYRMGETLGEWVEERLTDVLPDEAWPPEPPSDRTEVMAIVTEVERALD